MTSQYDWLKIKENKKIITKDSNGTENGILIDILNRGDDIFKDRLDEKFQQFYMTTVQKNKFKGLHVHPFKIDTIFVPKGMIYLVIYTEPVTKEQLSSIELDFEEYGFIEMGEEKYLTITYPSKYLHGFWGIDENSTILNYRYPAWNITDNHQFDIEDKRLIYQLNCVSKTYNC
jgi:dTDP-4-dehydrorhamnose 3,5-epimerase-like enzyme